MAEQKIFPQQITVTGSTNGQVLTANTTSNTAYWAPANSWLTTVTSKNIIPAASNTYSLGSPTRRYKDLFLSGATMYLGNTTLSSTKKGALTIQAQGSATVQTLVSNSYLTSVYIANTTARTLISDRIQVANAAATYQTKSVERAALANTNLRINLLNTNLTGTNTAIRALDTAKLSVANAITLYATKASPTTSGLLAHTGRATISTNLLVSGNTTLSGTLVANGTVGTAGYYLRTSGTGVYWSPASSGAGGTFTGGTVSGATTFSSGVTLSSTLTAGASVGTSGQALVSTGTGVQWGALSPGYNYSSQFNGSSTFLTTPTSAAFNLNGVDWTIECWFYCTATPPANVTNIIQSYQGTNNWQPYVAIGLNTNLTFQIVINAVGAATTQTFTLNSWNHVALVRSGGVVKFYLNGVATSVSVTSDITSSNLNWFIGKVDNAQGGGGYVYYYTGYLSNVRIVKGTAVYTAAFTPPTSPLSAITNTSLLTCNAITPTSDSSTNNHALTNTGPVTTTAVQSPFTSTTVSIPTASLTAVRQQFTGDGSTTSFSVAGGYTPNAISVFVNGVLLRNGTEVTVTNGSTVVFAIAPLSGALIDVIGTVPTTYSSITPVSYSVGFTAASNQFLTVPTNTAFAFGSSNHTIEFWMYQTARGTYDAIWDQGSGTSGSYSSSSYYFYSAGYASTCGLLLGNGAGAWGVNISAAAPSLNAWHHVAIVRNGNTFTFYIDGVGTSATYSGAVGAQIDSMTIGCSNENGAKTNKMSGYVSNVRVVKGVAVYTGNFTPPSSPLQAVQTAGTSGSNINAITGTQTSLLTCNGPTIIDGSTNAFTITNNGSAPVSTAIVPTFTNVTINNPSLSTYQAAYLVVAGGGGGGYPAGGGGGAGGLLTNSTLLSVGTTYSFTVGAGGNGGLVSGGVIPTIGTNSVMSGAGLTTITAFGGGYGGSGGGSTGIGSSGGSGGGAGNNGSAASGSAGTSGQGFAGGNNSGASPYPSGGGGGAGAAGSNASGSASGAGGAGVSSSITGSSVTYAGGGGGAGTSQGASAGAGGAGGGGAGGGAGTSGTTNTGGGGGGASNAGAFNGGAGGSGVVIIAVPYANYTGTTTGSPTVTTVTTFSGSYKILTFTASGSYTA